MRKPTAIQHQPPTWKMTLPVISDSQTLSHPRLLDAPDYITWAERRYYHWTLPKLQICKANKCLLLFQDTKFWVVCYEAINNQNRLVHEPQRHLPQSVILVLPWGLQQPLLAPSKLDKSRLHLLHFSTGPWETYENEMPRAAVGITLSLGFKTHCLENPAWKNMSL